MICGGHFPSQVAKSDGKVAKNVCLGTHPADSPDSLEVVEKVTPGTYLPHAPGVRMT